MLMQLTSPDAAWRPYWDDNMLWFGPGGFGSYMTLDAFQQFQTPFEQTFEGWGDGRAEGVSSVSVSCKAGDGQYAFLSGWPAITGVHFKPFMGIAPEGKRIYLRDWDWWRCEDGKILENWCMVDTLHLAHQLGRDVIAEIKTKKREKVALLRHPFTVFISQSALPTLPHPQAAKHAASRGHKARYL